jgi:hypothetical protein
MVLRDYSWSDGRIGERETERQEEDEEEEDESRAKRI